MAKHEFKEIQCYIVVWFVCDGFFKELFGMNPVAFFELIESQFVDKFELIQQGVMLIKNVDKIFALNSF